MKFKSPPRCAAIFRMFWSILCSGMFWVFQSFVSSGARCLSALHDDHFAAFETQALAAAAKLAGGLGGESRLAEALGASGASGISAAQACCACGGGCAWAAATPEVAAVPGPLLRLDCNCG